MGLTASSIFKLIPTRFSIESISSVLVNYPKQDFQIRLWDGTGWGCAENPKFSIIIKDPIALRHMLLAPSELTLGESYVFDELDIRGDIEAAIELGDYLISRDRVPASTPLLTKLLTFPVGNRKSEVPGAQLDGSLHSRKRDRLAIRYHYDLPTEFYALWLDERHVYSCAYFEREDVDLDTAQEKKLDYICRKLRLSPGERLLDVGCGWGALLIHAAKYYGVEAVGITLSVRQAEVARERIRKAGLNGRCRVEICDYRDLEVDRPFDKVASVGMFEHVGEKTLREYFVRVDKLLRPGGAFFNSGISVSATYVRRGPSFIDRYVFPDGDLVPIHTTLAVAEACGFEVRDVESLREHYALTLRHWVQRLQDRAEEAQRIAGRETYRIWRLYMAASAHSFQTGRTNLYHVLLAKPVDGSTCIPLTRTDWYRDRTCPRVISARSVPLP